MSAMGTNGAKGQKAKGKGRDIWWGLEGFFDVKPRVRCPVSEFPVSSQKYLLATLELYSSSPYRLRSIPRLFLTPYRPKTSKTQSGACTKVCYR
jgi:hypothetical protein